jgi:hypothetical protein
MYLIRKGYPISPIIQKIVIKYGNIYFNLLL